jgi:RNA recognition motif-containing protein
MTTTSRIYIGGLRTDVQRQDVEDHFGKIAPIKDIMVKSEKGFAFVVSFSGHGWLA